MKKIVLTLGIVLSLTTLNSCKKETTTPTTTNNTKTDTTKIDSIITDTVKPPVNNTNLICDGTTLNEYMPIKYGNTWMYDNSFFDNYELKDSMTYNEKKYFKNGSNNTYYGVDPLSKDIYYYNGNSQMEYMMLPANPSLNQTWEFPNKIAGWKTDYLKVTNLSTTTKTLKCSYKDVLEVSLYSDKDHTKLIAIYYYKKGLGLVNMYEENGYGGFTYNGLKTVVIK
jgi:hypothetical protein